MPQIRREKQTTISEEVIVAFHPTVKRIATALIPSLLSRCFSLFLPHLRTLAKRKGRKIVFVSDWWTESLFVPLYCHEI